MSIDSPIRREANRRTEGMRLANRPTRPEISLITEGTWCVLSPDDTMGFVDRVGPVYVAYSGDYLPHAVEVGQALSWDIAVAMVVRHFNSRSTHSRQSGA